MQSEFMTSYGPSPPTAACKKSEKVQNWSNFFAKCVLCDFEYFNYLTSFTAHTNIFSHPNSSIPAAIVKQEVN
jgi:hypothetical protein